MTLPDGACLVIEWFDIGPEEWRADYTLRIPLRDTDIRREDPRCHDGALWLQIGSTERGGGMYPPMYPSNFPDTPFREGCHIKWDAIALGLPAFVKYGEKMQHIDPRVKG